MKKTYLLLLTMSLFFVFVIQINAQISEGGTPYSITYQIESNDIDCITLPAPNVEKLMAEDEFFEKNGEPPRIGVPILIGLNPETAGTWTEMPNGDKIWRLAIESKGARSIGVSYDSFQIPENGKLFLYSADKSHIIGAFTSNTNPDNLNFATEMIRGEKVIIEYIEFATNQESTRSLITKNFQLDISHIIYYYKSIFETKGGSEACEVNVICSPVGDNWQDEKRGVALIDMQGYVCSGTLINNTSQNCVPYFLTAYHCNATASAAVHNQWVFYFNYAASTCSGTTSSANSITGCSVKATSNITGGSDLQLVQLNSSPSTSWNIYYNGWSRATTAATGGVSIHHPAGDIKKISTFTGTLTTSTWSGGQTNAHWLVYWTSNANGWGVTEGGSSGSPIFNNTGLIVGTLSGGSSYCSAQSQPDLYGKFDKHWTNGSLATWLDPTSTGATTCAGIYYPCSTTLNANFSGNPTTVAQGGSVAFTDLSTGSPTSWSWSFPGGTPSSSTSQNPTIVYNTIGTYNVTLSINSGADTELKTGYITVVQASSGFSLDFEACSDFSASFTPWTVNDVVPDSTWGSQDTDFPGENLPMAFIAFNSTTCTPAWSAAAPHGGVRCGACFSELTAYKPNNDWLISPQLQMGNSSSISLWVKSLTGSYGLERFKIGVSTTNNSPASFTIISSGSYETAPTTWTQKTYSLASYNNQNIYIGINCVSDDAFVFLIDDIQISTVVGQEILNDNKDFQIFPNPANESINIKSPYTNYTVTIYNNTGQMIKKLNSNENFMNIDVREFESGIYNFVITSDSNQLVKKISISK
jgi:PKD repeat protein